MKKIISLIIAGIMLASMAVTTSAVDFWGDDDLPYVADNPVFTDDDFRPNFSGNIILKPTSPSQIYTWWYDKCRECEEGVALYKVEDGNINWKCLDKDCGKNGTITLKPSTTVPTITCDHCDKSDKLSYESSFIRDKIIYKVYYCSACEKFTVKQINNQTTTPNPDVDSDKILPIICGNHSCAKIASFLKYEVIEGKLYCNYICSDGHVTKREASIYIPGYDYYNKYLVRVICSVGGDYSISGSAYASYGEKKTINFTADYGYVLANVIIDGVSYGPLSSMTITVKDDTLIQAYFVPKYTANTYVIKSSVVGNGSITAIKNGSNVSAGTVGAKFYDVVTYKFTPASSNYYVSSVKVDGIYVGKPNSYTFNNTDENHTIEVTFSWKSPYTDVTSKYLTAVEYVTEAGIMSSSQASKTKFLGSTEVTIYEVVAALAEMADTTNKLYTDAARIKWAMNNGIITEETKLNTTCDVRTICDIVKAYLGVLEDINDISFVKVSDDDTAKETAIKINMVTEKGYEKNRNIHRYDLASVCHLIANLKY